MPIDSGNTTWMFISTGLVMLMTPALGFFEAGLMLRKDALYIITNTFSGLAILSRLWFIIGNTLVFGISENGLIGNKKNIFLENIPLFNSVKMAPTIPGVSFIFFEMMFAVITLYQSVLRQIIYSPRKIFIESLLIEHINLCLE